MGTVLHNVIDGINDSWVRGEQVGVLLVDFVKAFDSVEHEYIKKCLEHFNLGPTLVGMVMTLLRDRKASINMGSTYSKTFDIKRGTPQGDRSSPYIFINCYSTGNTVLIKYFLNECGSNNNSIAQIVLNFFCRFAFQLLSKIFRNYLSSLNVPLKC